MRKYVWCTYRDWSFRVLEGIQGVDGWQAGLIVTTPDCRYDFARFEAAGIPVLRVDPKVDLRTGGVAFQAIQELEADTVFHYGWSWIVPNELLALCPNVTLHPGKLPKDRGGSPLQNQIRNGETWSYANIIELVEGLDEGPIYLRERFSLAGEIEDVWVRMTTVGTVLTRAYLQQLGQPHFQPKPQVDEPPTIYWRVKPGQEELLPAQQPAQHMYNIVRAHSERDPNTYVRPAFLALPPNKLIVLRATCEPPAKNLEVLPWATDTAQEQLARHCARVSNDEAVLKVTGADGAALYIQRCYLALR